jgi:fatty acid desaturase
MLVYSIDRRSLIFVLLNLMSLWGALYITPSVFSPIIILFLAFMGLISCHINHNQMHVEIFQNPTLNKLFNGVLGICMGLPPTLIYEPHVVNHHPNVCRKEDWAGAHLAEPHKGVRRILIYVLRSHIETARNRPSSLFLHLPKNRRSSLIVETILLLLFIGFAICLNPWTFFLHCFLPWFLATNALVFMNFMVHDGCDYESEFRHSHTFNSKIGNYFLFNSGYHLAHHLRPKLHWSQLPTFQQENLRANPEVSPEIQSLTLFFWRRYFGRS